MEKKDTRRNIIYGIIVIAIVLAVIIIINVVSKNNNNSEVKNEINNIQTNQVEELPQDSIEMQNPTEVDNVVMQ